MANLHLALLPLLAVTVQVDAHTYTHSAQSVHWLFQQDGKLSPGTTATIGGDGDGDEGKTGAGQQRRR